MLEQALQNMNDVFNNKVGRGPNGASANIVFRLASKNGNGMELQKPGYNRSIMMKITLNLRVGDSMYRVLLLILTKMQTGFGIRRNI